MRAFAAGIMQKTAQLQQQQQLEADAAAQQAQLLEQLRQMQEQVQQPTQQQDGQGLLAEEVQQYQQQEPAQEEYSQQIQVEQQTQHTQQSQSMQFEAMQQGYQQPTQQGYEPQQQQAPKVIPPRLSTETSIASDNLYILGLPAEITDRSLQVVMSQYCEVVSCKVLPPTAGSPDVAAFVRCAAEDQAKWVLQNLNRNIPTGLQKPVTVMYAGQAPVSEQQLAEQASQGVTTLARVGEAKSSTNLYIKGLPAEMTEFNLREIMSQYCEVKTCKVLPPKGTHPDAAAFVCCATEDQAQWILQNLHNKIPSGLQKPIMVKYADHSPPESLVPRESLPMMNPTPAGKAEPGDKVFTGWIKWYNPSKRFGIIHSPEVISIVGSSTVAVLGSELVGVNPADGDVCQFRLEKKAKKNLENPYSAVDVNFINSAAAAQRDQLFQQSNGQVFNGNIQRWDAAACCGWVTCEYLSLNLRFLKMDCRDPIPMYVPGAPCRFTFRLMPGAKPVANNVYLGHTQEANQGVGPPGTGSMSSSAGGVEREKGKGKEKGYSDSDLVRLGYSPY